MRLRRFAFWLSFGTLALLMLALAWLWTADLGIFKPQVERFVTEQTGRKFTIDGNFYVDLAHLSSVIAEDVHFQNADWADQEDMVTVGRLEVRLDLWSLVKGPILIELIDVDDASISLINPEDGEPNWAANRTGHCRSRTKCCRRIPSPASIFSSGKSKLTG
jgi:uncharacterized protein involved in outer membrane biogenesis